MTNENESKQQIVKSSAVVGGAELINIAINLAKIKLLALLLGPAGIGLVALFNSFMTLSATFSGLGIYSSGVRQIADVQNDAEALSRVRKTLFVMNLCLGLFGGFIIWQFRFPISELLFSNSTQANDVGLLGLGVFLTLIAASQTALLQGMRKISELAKIKIFSAFISAALGLISVYYWGEKGLVIFVIAVPAGSVVAAWYYCQKVPITKVSFDIKIFIQQARPLIRLGFMVMLSALLLQCSQLLVRYLIVNDFSLVDVGQFHAAWVISMTYIGFVLTAMATDYYPRLVGIIGDKEAVNTLVAQQTEIALLLAAPVLIAMLALAPFVITVLYSGEFSKSADILRWQIMGDLLKIFSWPLGFIVLAQGKGGLFFITELVWNVSYCLMVYVGLDIYGLESTGYAFFLVYIIYALMMYLVIKPNFSIHYSKLVINLMLFLICSSFFLIFLSTYSNIISAIVGIMLALVLFGFSFYNISHLGFENSTVLKINNKIEKVSAYFNKSS